MMPPQHQTCVNQLDEVLWLSRSNHCDSETCLDTFKIAFSPCIGANNRERVAKIIRAFIDK